MTKTRKLIFISFFIALQVVLTRFLGIETPIIRISFGFLPLAMTGMLFGPVWGGVAGAVADLLGMAIFPKGAYFPGFTLSTALSGAIYGLFLYKKSKNLVNITLATAIVVIFVNLGLNSLWLSMITGKGLYALIIPRIIKNLIELPVRVFVIYVSWKSIGSYYNKTYTDVAV
ncbi:folate family ECF transporter S component [uncultured Clostridium sp.]|uniref:folate family ECF transporter S component n=1 Tax=uncultured Clostridium sp. TaxID=59620 RepID=UPI0028E433EF|nr:folate family ECF transporter S component [uncultured Clostridium sp.]